MSKFPARSLIVLVVIGAYSRADDARLPNHRWACGPRAVGIALELIGKPATDASLASAFEEITSGTHSFSQLKTALERCGASSTWVNLSDIRWDQPAVPVITCLRRTQRSAEPDHFVVLYGGKGRTIQIIDDPLPPMLVSADVLLARSEPRALLVQDAGSVALIDGLSRRRAAIVCLSAGVALVGLVLLIRNGKPRPCPHETGELS